MGNSNDKKPLLDELAFDPSHSSTGQQTVIALCDNITKDYGYLSFRKGDRLIVIETDQDLDLLWAKNAVTNTINGSQGYVSRNHVVPEAVATEDWFFGQISRDVAEKLILDGHQPIGTFLIRISDQMDGTCRLSVRDYDARNGDFVKHYKIKTWKIDGEYYFITNGKATFKTLQQLVNHHKEGEQGFCRQLTVPCLKTKS